MRGGLDGQVVFRQSRCSGGDLERGDYPEKPRGL